MGAYDSIFGNADVGVGSLGGASVNAQLSAAPAFGPSSSSGPGHPLAPNDGFGLAFWWGVGAVVALLLIRKSLPG